MFLEYPSIKKVMVDIKTSKKNRPMYTFVMSTCQQLPLQSPSLDSSSHILIKQLHQGYHFPSSVLFAQHWNG